MSPKMNSLIRLTILLNIYILFGNLQTVFGIIRPNKQKWKELQTKFAVPELEFVFPSEHEKLYAIKTGKYDPSVPIPIDVDAYYPAGYSEPLIFVTIPRFVEGVPFTLATITNGTKLTAYPNYYWHRTYGYDCNGLTSVYRVQIDSCGQMWILDSGEINFKQHCAPQIVVIDIESGKLVHRYRLPRNMYTPGVSRFVTPLVDIRDPAPVGECRDAMVYMADVVSFSIIVYDMQATQSWLIKNKYTYPNPEFGTFNIQGDSFELMDGVIGLTVTPAHLGLRRYLYFHSLSNEVQVAVPLDVVNNHTHWDGELDAALEEFIVVGKRGVQCAASAMSSNGYLMCGYMQPIALIGWNVRDPFIPSRQLVLAKNPETLQFVSGIKVRMNPRGREEVWLLSNRIQKGFTGTLSTDEINYRVMRCDMENLLYGKPC